MHLIRDEIARQDNKKQTTGGNSSDTSTAPAPVNLTALQAQQETQVTLNALAARAHTTTARLHQDYGRLRSPVDGIDPLNWLIADLEENTRRLERIIDTPAERVTVGSCPACNRRILAPRDREIVQCDNGHKITAGEAYEHMREYLLDNMPTYLPPRMVPDMLAMLGYTSTVKQVEGWVRYGKVERTPAGVSMVDALELVETAARKTGK